MNKNKSDGCRKAYDKKEKKIQNTKRREFWEEDWACASAYAALDIIWDVHTIWKPCFRG
jgi:hypothetical protein